MLQALTEPREGSREGVREAHLAAFRCMLRARLLDDKFAALYRAGKIHGGVFLGRGQEALSAAIGVSLKENDVFAPLIRDTAGRLAFGEPVLDAVRTYLGSALGPMRGRDGNVHRGNPRAGLLPMISHLGAMVSVVNGMLFARRLKKVAGTVGAACLGFLLWNWPPATIFMGDVGSGYLGLAIAVIALAATRDNPAALWIWLILGGVFFVDATVTVVRRAIRRERLHQAHRGHAYQRLAQRWGSHQLVTIAAIALNIGWLLPCALLAALYPQAAVWIVPGALAPLVLLALALGSGARTAAGDVTAGDQVSKATTPK